MRTRSLQSLSGALMAIITLGAGQVLNAQIAKSCEAKRKIPSTAARRYLYYAEKYHVSLSEAQRRLAIQDQAAGIEDDLAQLLGKQYAAIWYDQKLTAAAGQ